MSLDAEGMDRSMKNFRPEFSTNLCLSGAQASSLSIKCHCTIQEFLNFFNTVQALRFQIAFWHFGPIGFLYIERSKNILMQMLSDEHTWCHRICPRGRRLSEGTLLVELPNTGGTCRPSKSSPPDPALSTPGKACQ